MPPEIAEPTTQPKFHLEAFNITKSLFELAPKEPTEEGEARPQRVAVAVQINAKIMSNPEVMKALVTLEVFVTPDHKWQPYRIEVTISGGFHGENVTVEQFDQFCRIGVPPILFPYVREAVNRMTMDAPNGPVRMDPMNVSEMLNQAAWSEQQIQVVPPNAVSPSVP